MHPNPLLHQANKEQSMREFHCVVILIRWVKKCTHQEWGQNMLIVNLVSFLFPLFSSNRPLAFVWAAMCTVNNILSPTWFLDRNKLVPLHSKHLSDCALSYMTLCSVLTDTEQMGVCTASYFSTTRRKLFKEMPRFPWYTLQWDTTNGDTQKLRRKLVHAYSVCVNRS